MLECFIEYLISLRRIRRYDADNDGYISVTEYHRIAFDLQSNKFLKNPKFGELIEGIAGSM